MTKLKQVHYSHLRKASERKVEFDYLRTFAVILVLCHHAILAYTQYAFINIDNPIANSNPVVNEQRWLGFDLIVAFNETFFMPLMFFISGLFVWQSLAKKGARKYFSDRLKRLGLPFAIGVLFLIPLAYYPAKLQVGLITGADADYMTFWFGMVRSGFQTAGPLWFIWLLLLFDFLASILYRVAPFPGSAIRKWLITIIDRPVVFFCTLLGISIAVYLPIALVFGPQKWIGTGPFNAQASRILLYLVYFLVGIAVGACGLDRSTFRFDGALARYWWAWFAVGQIFFIVFIIMFVVVSKTEPSIVSEIAFVASCGATVFSMVGLFLRFVKGRMGILDSLSENAYGIYLVHYVFVTWLQYLFLGSALHPTVKGLLVFTGTLIFSWGSVAVIRRIPGVAKII